MSSSLEERVAAAVEAHRDDLVQLVRQAVDEQLALLVDAELAARLNGHAGPAAPAGETVAIATRRCTVCDLELPVSAFRGQRGQCRTCRNRLDVARREQRRHAANGRQADAAPVAAAAAEATKSCRRCGRDLPVSAFEKHRKMCTSCRVTVARERRERAASTAAEGP